MTYAQIKTLFNKLTKTNSSSMSNVNLNDYTQPAEDRVTSLIMQSDGRWQYDDNNNTDFPEAKTSLISGQQDYSLATSHIRIVGAAILTNAGLWQRLLPFDPEDLKAHYSPLIDKAQFFSTPGRPLYYDKLGSSIILYPAPDNGITVTLNAGLKLYFERASKHFDWTTSMFDDSTGSTASSPGFNSLYHKLIPLWAAYDYCITNLPQLAPGYMTEIQRLEAALLLDYNQRDKDERSVFTMAPVRHR